MVTIYVRKGSEEGSRQIGFTIPDGLDSIAWLDDGWAIDGTQLVRTLAPPFSPARLLDVERGLIYSLRKLGIDEITFG